LVGNDPRLVEPNFAELGNREVRQDTPVDAEYGCSASRLTLSLSRRILSNKSQFGMTGASTALLEERFVS
jgi:hypothetical protein